MFWLIKRGLTPFFEDDRGGEREKKGKTHVVPKRLIYQPHHGPQGGGCGLSRKTRRVKPPFTKTGIFFPQGKGRANIYGKKEE